MIYEDYNSVNSVEVVMLKGEKGDRGPRGDTGPKGDTGLAGASASTIGQGYGICETAGPVGAKEATLNGYSLVSGGIVSIKFTYEVYGYSGSTVTLNINAAGAKEIWLRGAPLHVDKVIGAGDVATFMYDGTRYHLISIDPGASKGATTDVAGGRTWKFRNSDTLYGIQECWTIDNADSTRAGITMNAGEASKSVTCTFPFSFQNGRPNVFATVSSVQNRSGTVTYSVTNASASQATIKIERTEYFQTDGLLVGWKAEG